MLNIDDFTNKKDYREFCHAPFNSHGYTVATNGSTIIFSPEQKQYAKNPALNEERTGDILASCLSITDYVKMPRILYQESLCRYSSFKWHQESHCDSCDNTGITGYHIVLTNKSWGYNKKYIELINDIDTLIAESVIKTANFTGLFFKNSKQFGVIMPMKI